MDQRAYLNRMLRLALPFFRRRNILRENASSNARYPRLAGYAIHAAPARSIWISRSLLTVTHFLGRPAAKSWVSPKTGAGAGSSARPEIPLFPREQRVSPDRPGAVQGAKRRSVPLTARTDLELSRARGKGIQERGGRAGRGSPRRACADDRGDTLLVELRPLLHIHPHPQNSKRLHLRFHLGRADHPERVK